VLKCQEIGHTFGLDHQDESRADLNTCMDYSNNLDNPSPNQHDYGQLASIDSHLDSTTRRSDEGRRRWIGACVTCRRRAEGPLPRRRSLSASQMAQVS